MSNETNEKILDEILLGEMSTKDYDLRKEHEKMSLLRVDVGSLSTSKDKEDSNKYLDELDLDEKEGEEEDPDDEIDLIQQDSIILPSFKARHDLKEDAELSLFQLNETSNSIIVNGQEYFLNDLNPVSLYSEGATISIDGQPAQLLTSLDATSTLVVSQGSDEIFVTMDSNGDIDTIDILGDDGSDTYLASVVPGIFAAVEDKDLDPTVLEKIAHYQDVEDAVEPPSRNLRKRSTSSKNQDKPAMFDFESHDVLEDEGRALQAGCSSLSVIEVAIAFDSTLCSRYGGYSNTKAEVEKIVARASALYGSQGACAKLSISHIEGYCSASSDPYRAGINLNTIGCNSGEYGVLQHFRDYWIGNRGWVHRDASHLFYARDFPGETVGCAYTNTLCSSSWAYGSNDLSFSSDLNRLTALFAHELGHNTGLNHITDPSRTNVMNTGLGFGVHTWSATAVNFLRTNLPTKWCVSQFQISVDKWLSNFGYSAGGWRTGSHPRFVADVNGDGKDDIVGFGEAGVYVSYSTGTGFTAPSLKVDTFGSTAGGWRVDKHPRMVADVNGDGKADIVGFGNAGVYVSYSTGTGFTAPSLKVDTFGYTAGGWRTGSHPRFVADVNGDGKDDIVGFGEAGVYVSYSTGTGFTAPSLKVNNFGSTAGGWRVDKHPRMVADVNGDGKADIVGFGNAGVYVSYSTGTGFTAPSLKVDTFGYTAGGWRSDMHPRMLADMNGDGKADIVGFGNAGVYVSYSTGSGFTAPSLKVNTFGYTAGGWRVDRHPRMLADVNGDGKVDIVGFGYAGIYVALSTGNSFSPVNLMLGNFGYTAGGWRVDKHPRLAGDVTGEGKADIVGFGYAGVYVSTGDLA